MSFNSMREPSSVEQLVRYMVEPQDPDDAKKTFKYVADH